MSWDVELSGREESIPLGSAPEVRNAISEAHPSTDWSQPDWGRLEGDGWWIEFNIGDDDITRSIMLHVRGAGNPLPAIAALCRRNQWRALDLTTGEELDPENPSRKGWDEFTAFRDELISAVETENFSGIALPLVWLRLDGNIVRWHEEKKWGRAHDVTTCSVEFRRGINSVSILFGVIAIAIGLALFNVIPIRWLAWTAAALLTLTGITCFLTSRADWLVVEDGGRKHTYPLAAPPEVIAAFRARIESIRDAAAAR